MEEIHPQSLPYFFVTGNYPEVQQKQLDHHIREKTRQRFEKAFSRWEKNDLVGSLFGDGIWYSEDNINEIADKRGNNTSFTDERLSGDAEVLLENYNDRSGLYRQLSEEKFAGMELKWLAENILDEETVSRPIILYIDESTLIGYNNDRYAEFRGEPLDIDGLREVSKITDDEIEYRHHNIGEGTTSPTSHSPPSDFDDYLIFEHERPYGTISSHQGNSRLDVNQFEGHEDEIKDIIDIIQ